MGRMRWLVGLLGFLSGLESATNSLRATVVISEIMYHPPQGTEYEYVEIHNDGAAAVNIENWSFTSGIAYTFPAGTTIAAGGYIIVCATRDTLLAAYPALSPAIVYGDYAGNLDNGGERVLLVDAGGAERQAVRYDDDPPWDFLADGFGASLERLCFTENPSLIENWRASPVPEPGEGFGGTPGAPNARSMCPPELPSRPQVFISEVMYHPVLEEALVDRHEFLEIHSIETASVDLSGWRVSGVRFTFPPGSSIQPGQYLVLAKDRAALAAVSSYGLTPSSIFGEYPGDVDNGGERIALIGAGGQGIDSVSYDDEAPWPVGADALGAGESWLNPALLPLENHRYRGYSLERVSFDIPAGEIANWAPSPLDGATPGRANAGARAVPLAVVADIDVAPINAGDPLIRQNNQVEIRARFSPAGIARSVDLQYFIDDVALSGEAITTAVMFDDGTNGGDITAGDSDFAVILPGQPANTIVRYRFCADRDGAAGPGGVEIAAPRPTDPNAWYAYFVSPQIATTTRVYQLFISPANWTQMWDNIQGGRVSGCAVRAAWDATVPAVFVYDGQVFDAHVRYQGSRYNRSNGSDLPSWPYPGPARPSPVKALSWHIALPRYSPLEGQSILTLNKLIQGCPGYYAGVGYRLFEMADIPGPRTQFVRVHINGGYYHYMQEFERPGEELMERYHREQAAKYPERPHEDVGHLFKSQGCECDEGPYSWGDERQLFAACGYSAEARYSYTYDRKTHDWDSHAEFADLIADLGAARQALPNTAPLRAYFAERFDLDLLLNYVAIYNWSVPFDDMFQNHFLYQRLSDGKWFLTPWDLDLNFGGWKGSSASLYVGEEGDVDNRSGWWNRLKDAVLKSYRAEYEERLLLLNNTILHPDVINPLIDEVTAQANLAEAQSAPAGLACGSFSGGASSFRNFAASRHSIVNSRLSAVQVDAGPDQTVFEGTLVQFDARASRPDPGPAVTYAWDNGMTGDFPAFFYDQPGAYVVTLTLTASGAPFRDSVSITVLDLPETAFAERSGQVVMEAESFHLNDSHGSATCWWAFASAPPAGFSDTGYMDAQDTVYTKFTSGFAAAAPELRYFIRFENPGTYRVWIRGLSGHMDYDSVHVGLDGAARDESFAQRFTVDAASYLWSGDTRGQGPQMLTVAETGVHVLSLWVRESGQIIDKILLSTDAAFTPSGAGPAESEQVPLTTRLPFVRGDANGDRLVDISDALAVLLFAFDERPTLDCEDHGDTNDDGSLNGTDAVALLNYLFLSGPAPRAPFPTAGFDTTPDAHSCGD